MSAHGDITTPRLAFVVLPQLFVLEIWPGSMSERRPAPERSDRVFSA